VVGVFGKWGAGKTSFMSQLEGEISKQKNKKNKQVWFNAWKYDNQNDLWAALLQAITSQVEANTNKFKIYYKRFSRLANWHFFINIAIILVLFGGSIWLFRDTSLLPKYDVPPATTPPNNATDLFLHFARVLLPSGLLAFFVYWLGVLKPIIELVRKMKNPLGLDVGELIHGKSLPDKIEGIRTFEKDLEIRLTDYIDTDGRLIVYIDDLDRCSPEHAVEIIEAVNLFLDTKRCIFVLGMDHKLISNCIELKYKELSERYKELYGDGSSYGEFFLKKIIQIPIAIPALTPYELIGFVESLLYQKEVKNKLDKKSKHAVDRGMVESISVDENISLSIDTKNIIATLIPYLEPNPRAIKRFYNMLSFIHFFFIANRDKLKDLNDTSLTLWFFLLYQFPDEIEKIDFYDKTISWSFFMSGCKGKCERIQKFFVGYLADQEHREILKNLTGKIETYYQVTRILEM
jgi:hypothetical protein